MPICRKCGLELPEEAFGWRRTRNMRREWCKKCANEYGKKRYKEIKDQGGVAKRKHDKEQECKICGKILPIKKFQYEPLRDLYDTTCNACKYKKQKKEHKLTERKEMFAKGMKYCTVCHRWLPKDQIYTGTYKGKCAFCMKKERGEKNRKIWSEETIIKRDMIEENRELLKIGKRKCRQCQETKDIGEFYTSDGIKYSSICVSCKTPKKKEIDEAKALFSKGFIKCTTCNEVLPISEYNVKLKSAIATKRGYQAACRKCQNSKVRVRYRPAKKHDVPETAQCELCGEIKTIDNFYVPYVLKGKDVLCNDCRAERKKKRKNSRKKKHRSKKRTFNTRIREKLRVYLKTNKSFRTQEYLGCSYLELRAWLESHFLEGMSWDNYGEWHIDHYVPLAYFDPCNKKDNLIAWHYRNLRPLWAKDNIAKGNKLPDDYQNRIDYIKKIRNML